MEKQKFIEINNDFDYGKDLALGKGRQLIRRDAICSVYVVLPDRKALAISYRGKTDEVRTCIETFGTPSETMTRFNEIKNILK